MNPALTSMTDATVQLFFFSTNTPRQFIARSRSSLIDQLGN